MKAAMAWVQALRPTRVYRLYASAGGNLLAAGMSFQALFAVFAAVWVGFSLFGIYLNDHPEVRDAVIAYINVQIPGFIKTGGPIDPAILDKSTALGWTGGLAIVVVLYTAINWFTYARTAVRRVFDLPPSTLNFIALKLYDLVLALGYGLVIIVSATASVIASQLLAYFVQVWGFEDESGVITGSFQGISFLIILVLDTAVLATFIRVLSGVPIPWRHLWRGSLLGGLAFGVLKIVGVWLLGRPESNPLIASFAIFVGLLVWFNLASRIYLLTASWIALGMQDEGIDAEDLGWVVPRRHSHEP
ncbi:membrane protein [Aurantimicrobium minutum]|uniref:YihY/virulence factor BrkB family protein n=1 Tax=Aurantimicrobium minutum TaxID=708131 RepID=UPI00247580B5|nr:YihY/virulence factor BrkB family protein [Aurantimicrobium minutum]MDH6531856.1 membrane protein [Aurantimicrobium minutum]